MRETGLDRPAAFEWLRARRLVDTPDSRIPAAAATNPSRRGSGETAGDRQTVRRNTAGLWPRPLAALPGHPHGHRTPRPPLAGPPQPVAARPSPARRSLWRPDLPLPAALRWLPDYDRRHTGAGALIAVAAQPAAWLAAWPNPPQPVALQLVSIDAEGLPALDRLADAGGLDKRTLGTREGAVVLLGNPAFALAVASVEVAEGLADALALAARADAPRRCHPRHGGNGVGESGPLAGRRRPGPRVRRPRYREGRTAARRTAGGPRPGAGGGISRWPRRRGTRAGTPQGRRCLRRRRGIPARGRGLGRLRDNPCRDNRLAALGDRAAGANCLLCGGMTMTLKGEPTGQDALDLAERLAALLAEYPNDQAARESGAAGTRPGGRRRQGQASTGVSLGRGLHAPPRGNGWLTAGCLQAA